VTEAIQPGRRERNKTQTRERLLDAARELLDTRGTAGTVEEIAEFANISRATFFNYFPSKDDLFTALYTRHMNDFAQNVDAVLAKDLSTSDRIVSLFTDFIEESESRPDYLRVVTGEIERISAPPDVLAERGRLFTSQILRIVRAGVEDLGDVRSDYPPQFLAQMVAAIYISAMRYWKQDPEYTVIDSFEQAGRFAAESLTQLSSPRPGREARADRTCR